jgi:hypothetical protein
MEYPNRQILPELIPDRAVGEHEILGIDRPAVQPDLVMDVRACGFTRRPDERDRLSTRHVLSADDEDSCSARAGHSRRTPGRPTGSGYRRSRRD